MGVLNLSELVIALRPDVQPGEKLDLKIVREGKEENQGVGYLDDGTMVVIEGAKKFIEITVKGADSKAKAKDIAFSIANSLLVKTAIAGEDPNWGRIAMAIGKSGENIIANKVQIKIGNFLVAEQSKIAKDYNEKDVKEYMKWDSIEIEVNLNIGSASHKVYTCDFTHDYININADYRN